MTLTEARSMSEQDRRLHWIRGMSKLELDGYEAEAKAVQDLYLDGKKREAAAEIPREFLELTNLVGPESWVRERISAYVEAGVSVLNIMPVSDDPVGLIAKIRSWVDEG
jgi:hypothetical protein